MPDTLEALQALERKVEREWWWLSGALHAVAQVQAERSVEVENALMSFPGVVEAAVTASPCPVLGERVRAFVVAHAGVQVEDLKRHCAGLLADYKVPEAFTLSDEPLPRNANGKLLKRNLRDGLGRASVS